MEIMIIMLLLSTLNHQRLWINTIYSTQPFLTVHGTSSIMEKQPTAKPQFSMEKQPSVKQWNTTNHGLFSTRASMAVPQTRSAGEQLHLGRGAPGWKAGERSVTMVVSTDFYQLVLVNTG